MLTIYSNILARIFPIATAFLTWFITFEIRLKIQLLDTNLLLNRHFVGYISINVFQNQPKLVSNGYFNMLYQNLKPKLKSSKNRYFMTSLSCTVLL